MAVKIRLMRLGKKRSPFYRVVVTDGRAPRDGRYIDLIGRYDPNQDPSLVEIDNEKAVDWMAKGAQPTDAARKLLEISGALSSYKVSSGKIHTVGSTPAVAPSPGAGASEVAAPGADASEDVAPVAEDPEDPSPAAAADTGSSEEE